MSRYGVDRFGGTKDTRPAPFRRLRLERLKPLTLDYAMLPILEGFNWAECLAKVDEVRLYLVVFRSVRREAADPVRLKAYDDRAYEEARAASGLLYYFRGALTAGRQCLSFCVWESQEQAQAATRLLAHEAAAHITDEMYVSFELERWILIKRSGSTRLELRPVPSDTPRSRSLTSSQAQWKDGAWPGIDMSGAGTTELGFPSTGGADAAG
jgi:hypothetical protein